jgi:hypothetical protein
VVEEGRPAAWSAFSVVVRLFIGVLWAVGFFFACAVVAAIVASIRAGGDAELQQQLAQRSGETIGPWLLLGSIALPIVLACLGWLPGVRWKRR